MILVNLSEHIYVTSRTRFSHPGAGCDLVDLFVIAADAVLFLLDERDKGRNLSLAGGQ